MALPQVLHRGQEAGTDGRGDACVESAQPHGHFAAQREPTAAHAVRIHFRPRYGQVHDADQVPQTFAHQRACGSWTVCCPTSVLSVT